MVFTEVGIIRHQSQWPQEVIDAIKELQHRLHPFVESVYDETRVYVYGVCVHPGLFDSNTKTINDMRDWCNNTFGPKPYGEYYGDRWMVSNNTFWFKNERDRTLFLIQFSQ